MRYGLIAGNGRFPLLALESARSLGHEVVVVAHPGGSLARKSSRWPPATHWISLGALSKLIEILQAEGITEVMMAGQVKHAKIFSSIRPDWRLVKLLAALPSQQYRRADRRRDEDPGRRRHSTARFHHAAQAAAGGRRRDDAAQAQQGRADAISITAAASPMRWRASTSARASPSASAPAWRVEAMEGTDAMLRRAAGLVNGRRLSLVKVARRREHLLFDVPVAGLEHHRRDARNRDDGARRGRRAHAAARPR